MRRFPALACLASLITLAACGGDEDDAAPPAPVTVAPTITQQPANQDYSAGTIVFTATASGTPAPTITWTVDAAALAANGTHSQGLCRFDHVTGAGTLTLSNVSADCIGAAFAAVATNTAGNATSATVQLQVVQTRADLMAGAAGTTGNVNGTGASVRFNTPNYLTRASDGRIAVGDFGNSAVRLVSTAGVVTTLAGSGNYGYADGVGTAASFNGNGGLAFDSAGNVFVSDWDNHVVRRIAPDGTVTTFAGSPGVPGSANGTGAAARFTNPNGLAIDASDNVYVSDWGNHTIRRITPAGVVTTVVGSPGAPGSVDGNGSAARVSGPSGLAFDAAGNLYLADQFNHLIRRLSPTGDLVTLAGSAGLAGHVDGTGAAARLASPAWITVTAGGTVFVVSAAGDTVRRVSTSGEVATVVGTSGSAGALQLGANPVLRNARGVWAIGERDLLLTADQTLVRIRLP
jgi:hypothetical protein